ncbi:signal recognition particle-docking protein FtsY [Enterobacteriaceae endosymbiont of Donacia cincticornis]|uniref:signal recognition particle-docking protein FtsY n=1 Tax=Enterobacteriaceae endosymbiont of Donacia cincticornis TaxID=2675773 RepID=UPI001449C054|nr:signal recognition particle-docking protein FtsY [Enterobacteriaceae endosymbiont of Donacia cincticornis]QJC35934.1 signal recognition particle-docking protein FtsY [Enterobacteriaceae endosymbiont of Donacia cincticornis]
MINQQDHNMKKKHGFLNYLKKNLIKTTKNLSQKIINLFRKKNVINEKLFNKLKETLIISDIDIYTTNKICHLIKNYAQKNKIKDSLELYDYLKIEMLKILLPVEVPLIIKKNKKKPFIILVIGVNGVGKTTTIGKIAHYFYKQKKSVLLASGDTFRAGAYEQLFTWSKRSHSILFKSNKKKDSSAIIFDAISYSKKKQIDILIADTSGRLHNNIMLMEELKKIARVIKKNNYMLIDEVMFILDANIGQNSINQFKMFHENIGITGITITKIDGTAKGGVIFSLANKFNIPIRFLGSGEKITDLNLFNAKDFINAIFIKD